MLRAEVTETDTKDGSSRLATSVRIRLAIDLNRRRYLPLDARNNSTALKVIQHERRVAKYSPPAAKTPGRELAKSNTNGE